MRFLSVCSGIEAASVAWAPLGWKAAAFSEIEPFPSAVLAHHYPDVPNLGGMTKFKDWPDDLSVDLLCGGTPCQSFSVAGLRKGLADPRGNLMLTYGAIAAKYRPRWLVWENVPGVLSSNEGGDFGSFLGLLGELGYGFAYRVLDAQHFGVPQRRRRVFVVGCLGNWRAAAAVLFERHSLSGHPAPRRQAGQGTAARSALSVALRGREGGGTAELGDDIGLTLRASKGGGDKPHARVAGTLLASGKAAGSATQQDAEAGLLIAHSLRGEGFDASEDGTGRGTPLVPVLANALTAREIKGADSDCTSTLLIEGSPSVAFDPMPTMTAGPSTEAGHNARSGHCKDAYIAAHGMQVRRLTPRECERLQGFPDDYTAVPHRGKAAADGPRYKALGNSWAVPVIRWIGHRFNEVDSITLGCAT